MSEKKIINFGRRSIIGILGASVISATPVYSKAFGFLRGAGDGRRLKMYSRVTGEKINIYYAIDGLYIAEAVDEISHFMRDTRENKIKKIDKIRF